MEREFLFSKIDDFILYLQKEKNYSVHTLRAYKKDLESFFDFLREKKKSDVDQKVITFFIGFLLKYGMDARTVARKLSSLKSFFKGLKKMGVISENPAQLIKTPKIKKHLPGFLTYDQIKKSLEISDPRDRAIMEILICVIQINLWFLCFGLELMISAITSLPVCISYALRLLH
ncbi:unnamed protein product [marine sediment metagenome]|uniref:Core-binding (CB) domain-containing protein n=1 Tax=marine sediment metagenome TaxID=412755 RepID=X1MY91_9ZZZZ